MKAKDHSTDFIHPELNEEITAIGGHFLFTKEVRLPFRDKEILYLMGYGVVDTSCCGIGGLAYALAPGFVANWKYAVDKSGRSVSRVVPVDDPGIQAELKTLIQRREAVHQVNFL